MWIRPPLVFSFSLWNGRNFAVRIIEKSSSIPQHALPAGKDDQQPDPELEPEYRSFDRSRSHFLKHRSRSVAGVCFFLTDFPHFLVQMCFANLLKLHY